MEKDFYRQNISVDFRSYAQEIIGRAARKSEKMNEEAIPYESPFANGQVTEIVKLNSLDETIEVEQLKKNFVELMGV